MFNCSSPILRQYLVIMTANLNMMCFGLFLSWPSPMLPKLKNGNGTGLPEPINDEEGSWIVSIGIISALPLQCIIGFIMDKIGRKMCLLLSCIPRLAVTLMLMFAPEVWMVLLARALDGLIGAGLVLSVVPTYSSEIASKEIRGALGSTAQVASATGMLIFLGAAPFLPYFYVNLLYLCIVIAVSIPMCFIPESPYYLYSKGRKEESMKVLIFLRGSKMLANEEIKEYEQYLNKSSTMLSKIEVFKDPVTLRTFCKAIMLSFLLELVGFNPVMMYMMEILKSSKTTINDNVASLVNGCIQLIASFFTILLTDKFGRKPILITTLLGMGVGTIGLGAFFQLRQQEYEISGFLNLIPLLSLMLFMFCYNAGMGSLLWILIAELFDGPARAVSVSMCSFVASIFVFLTIKYFITIINYIGAVTLYWWLSVNSVITAMFILFCIPETKGKTFGQIQMELGRSIKST